MKTDITNATAQAAEGTLFLGDDWLDPLEAGVRTRVRGFIEDLLEAELDTALGRDRYQRPRLAEAAVGGRPVVGAGHRHSIIDPAASCDPSTLPRRRPIAASMSWRFGPMPRNSVSAPAPAALASLRGRRSGPQGRESRLRRLLQGA